jgi:maltose/maltodextrin transport system substrate-binding protein
MNPIAVEFDSASRRTLLKSAVAVLIAACFNLPVSAAGKQITIWINGDKGYNGIQKVGDEFARKTGITVKVEHPDDAPNQFQQAALAGGGPDIWIWPHDRIGDWIKMGLLSPIQPSADLKRNVVSVAWDAFTVDGKVWGYPMSVEAIGLIYNKALIKTAPKTFEEIPALDAQLAKRGAKAIL